MAIFYIDPVAGNDANTGVDWANAWKTFASGPTAARIAPGDEMRIAKSPDPTNVGTATWTNQKRGNSITFSSAPTKQIDTCQAGWVTLGAGATVTNAQATTFMMYGTADGTGAALQVVTAASANGAYKNLGSTQDFSAHQQVSFWFRSSAAFDCTGAQNLTVRLCSDTAGVTVVDSLVMPKWNYTANSWYPIVIDKGSALGASIQSVSYVTTNTTTQTFYFAEMFASPAAGLTLQSLIEDNESSWYAIRSIRGADVWLISGYTPTTSTGGQGNASYIDAAWVGTTATFTTRKRETLKAFTSAGPAATVWCIINEAGIWSYPTKTINQYSFGWNTATNTRDGFTYADGLNQGTFMDMVSRTGWRIENFVAVRWSNVILNNISGVEVNNFALVACAGGLNLSAITSSSTISDFNRSTEILFYTGCASGIAITFGTGSGLVNDRFTFSIGKFWGNNGSIAVNNLTNSTITVSKIITGAGTTSAAIINSGAGSNNIITVTLTDGSKSFAAPLGYGSTSALYTISEPSRYMLDTVTGAPIAFSQISNAIVDVGTYSGVGPLVSSITNGSSSNVVRCVNNNSAMTGDAKWFSGQISTANSYLNIHDYGGPGFAAVFVGTSNNSGNGQYGKFELQVGTVNTPGSKAWAYSLAGLSYSNMGYTHSLKLASVAAEANKLITVTCYVRKSTTEQTAGIRVPAVFLPGYTSDITTSFSAGAGSWQQLTLTFTPTADCVFDLEAWVKTTTGLVSPLVYWDDLSITQAP